MERIADFMSSPIISIDSQSTAEDAAKYMGKKNITSLLIKEKQEYVGIITLTDLVKRLVAKGLDPKSTKLFSLMSKPLISMGHHMPLREGNDVMFAKNIKHLAVTKEGNIVGIITTKDMISAENDMY